MFRQQRLDRRVSLVDESVDPLFRHAVVMDADAMIVLERREAFADRFMILGA